MFCSLVEFDVSNGQGRVIKGDWDLTSKRFDDLDIAAAIRELAKGKVEWEATAFFKNAEKMLKGGATLWGCKGREDLLARCRDIERLMDSIRNHGYKSSEELDKEGLNWFSRPSKDEVTVAIGRNGQLLFCNGAHRLAIARALGTENIPVQVAVRHPVWMRFRKEVELYCKRNGGAIYQPAQHPDLDNIPYFHSCENRFEIIQSEMASKEGKLLDIGANWGYFCHRFEELGFECYAVEDMPENIYFLDYIKKARSRTFHIISKSVLESEVVYKTSFDVVLALNIFHHFLKTPFMFDRFQNLLKLLKCNEMFLEPHKEGESQMIDAYMKFSPEELVMFIAENCGLNHTKLIGNDVDGRNLFKLSKSDN